MKKIWDSFKASFVWIFFAVLLTAVLDLIGLTLPGEKEIGLGFILVMVLAVGAFIYKWNR